MVGRIAVDRNVNDNLLRAFDLKEKGFEIFPSNREHFVVVFWDVYYLLQLLQ